MEVELKKSYRINFYCKRNHRESCFPLKHRCLHNKLGHPQLFLKSVYSSKRSDISFAGKIVSMKKELKEYIKPRGMHISF